MSVAGVKLIVKPLVWPSVGMYVCRGPPSPVGVVDSQLRVTAAAPRPPPKCCFSSLRHERLNV